MDGRCSVLRDKERSSSYAFHSGLNSDRFGMEMFGNGRLSYLDALPDLPAAVQEATSFSHSEAQDAAWTTLTCHATPPDRRWLQKTQNESLALVSNRLYLREPHSHTQRSLPPSNSLAMQTAPLFSTSSQSHLSDYPKPQWKQLAYPDQLDSASRVHQARQFDRTRFQTPEQQPSTTTEGFASSEPALPSYQARFLLDSASCQRLGIKYNWQSSISTMPKSHLPPVPLFSDPLTPQSGRHTDSWLLQQPISTPVPAPAFQEAPKSASHISKGSEHSTTSHWHSRVPQHLAHTPSSLHNVSFPSTLTRSLASEENPVHNSSPAPQMVLPTEISSRLPATRDNMPLPFRRLTEREKCRSATPIVRPINSTRSTESARAAKEVLTHLAGVPKQRSTINRSAYVPSPPAIKNVPTRMEVRRKQTKQTPASKIKPTSLKGSFPRETLHRIRLNLPDYMRLWPFELLLDICFMHLNMANVPIIYICAALRHKWPSHRFMNPEDIQHIIDFLCGSNTITTEPRELSTSLRTIMNGPPSIQRTILRIANGHGKEDREVLIAKKKHGFQRIVGLGVGQDLDAPGLSKEERYTYGLTGPQNDGTRMAEGF